MISDDELIIMLRHIELYLQSGLTKDSYCVKNNLTIHTFSNILKAFSILNHKSSNMHQKMMDLVQEFLSLPVETNKEQFCKEKKVNIHTFKNYLRDTAFIQRASRITNGAFDYVALSKAQKWPKRAVLATPEKTEMKFIQVQTEEPKQVSIEEPPQKVQFYKVRNTLEFSIPSGITVTLPPETPNEDILKIIELLKDL